MFQFNTRVDKLHERQTLLDKDRYDCTKPMTSRLVTHLFDVHRICLENTTLLVERRHCCELKNDQNNDNMNNDNRLKTKQS